MKWVWTFLLYREYSRFRETFTRDAVRSPLGAGQRESISFTSQAVKALDRETYSPLSPVQERPYWEPSVLCCRPRA
jgi:hypothetical protein